MKCSLDSVVLGLKRADTPFFMSSRRAFDFCRTASIRVPQPVKPVGRIFYEFRIYFPMLWKRFKSLIYTTPIFCCSCESVGKHLQLCALPESRDTPYFILAMMSGSAVVSKSLLADSMIVRPYASATGLLLDTMSRLPATAKSQSKTTY